MSHRYLVLRLEAPMVAFGDVMVDSWGPIRDTPSVSAMTGLLANALGVRREESARLAQLQERLILACRVDTVDSRFTDFQTAQLGAKDRWWTTDGDVQERAGGGDTFKSPHIRERDYDSDVHLTVLIRLRRNELAPTLDDLAQAIQRPARPLFFGRKCCLPSAPLFDAFVEAPSAFDAFRLVPIARRELRVTSRKQGQATELLVTLPPDEPCPDGFEVAVSTERRDWPSGVHAGEQRRFRGMVERAFFGSETPI